MSTVKLQSSDGKVFEVAPEVVKQSVTIREKMEEGEDGDVIPLPKVNSPVFQKVLEWMNKHKDDPDAMEDSAKEERDKKLKDWDTTYIDSMDKGRLFEVILAADYLVIKGLLDLTCNTLSALITDKTPEQVREAFNIKGDFTEEEMKLTRMENEWCQDK